MLHDLEARRAQGNAHDSMLFQEFNIISKFSRFTKVELVVYFMLFVVILITIGIIISKTVAAVTEPSSEYPSAALQTSQFSLEYDDSVTNRKSKPAKNIIVPVKTKQTNVIKQKPIKVKTAVASTVIREPDTSSERVVHKRIRELTTEQRAEINYKTAYEYLLAKNSIKAQDELRNALMLLPGHIKARELLAGIYIKNGRIVEARTLLQYGMRIAPAHFIFAKLYARILMEQNETVTAIAVLLRNPPSQQADPDYHALLAALYQKNKQHQEAATLYGTLLTLRKNHGVWWLGLAISLEALGNESQAKLAYEKAKNSGNLSKGLYQYTHQRVSALEEIAYP